MRWRVQTFVQSALILWQICAINSEHKMREKRAESALGTHIDLAHLAEYPQGTELLLIDEALHDRKTYRLEDFFWTGSGDGGYDDNQDPYFPSVGWDSSSITTRQPPTTYTNTTSVASNQSAHANSSCEACPTLPSIEATPRPSDWFESDNMDADRQYWLVTVLKTSGLDPAIEDLRSSLTKLYKIAFQRQQERRLGIASRVKRHNNKLVNVYIHKIDKSSGNGTYGKMEILYHVSLSGRPVDPTMASADMALLSDREVQDEFGYPFYVKAEPYMKPSKPQQSVSHSQSAWLIISTCIAAVIVLLVAIALLSFCLSNRKHANDNQSTATVKNRTRDNLAFISDDGSKMSVAQYEGASTSRTRHNADNSPTYIKYRSDENLNQNVDGISRGSSSSGGVVQVSPLIHKVTINDHAKSKKRRLKVAVNRTAPMRMATITPDHIPPMHKRMSTTSSSSSTSSGRSSSTFSSDSLYGLPGGASGGVATPVSAQTYLSMPSVKAFPRDSLPEPMHKVLEPVSVVHLDHEHHDSSRDCVDVARRNEKYLIRSGSLSTTDPGVIGPLVWQQIQRPSPSNNSDDGTHNVSRMRKRFHDLLDDTFSIFGATATTITGDAQSVQSHPGVIAKTSHGHDITGSTKQQARPSSSIVPIRGGHPVFGACQPRGAWTERLDAPGSERPLSAPSIDMHQVRAEGKFSADDPAVPLIEAIKVEIGKCKQQL